MKKLRLKENCILYTTTRNQYGDFILNKIGTFLCLYRDASNLNRGVNYREEIQIQGTFWLDPSSSAVMGQIIGYSGLFYRIENVVNAKTLLTQDSVNFIKCGVSLYRAIS